MAFYGGLKGLLWANIVAGYAVWVMMTYLTDVWGLSFTHAAGFLNLWQGIGFALQFFFAFLGEALLGHFPMLLISIICYSIGLGLLSISTPPVTGPCRAYKPECIGLTQKILYYIGMIKICIGIAGQAVSLGPYFLFQVQQNSPIRDYTGRLNAFESALAFSICIGPITGSLLPIFVKERWSILFGVPTILYLVASLVFLSGVRGYDSMKPQGSPLTTVLRVLTACTLKIFQKLPNQPNELYEKDDSQDTHKLPHTPRLRFLDKAAILLPGKSRETKKWKLCTVTEVEETKMAILILPISVNFIVCGLVYSIGNTYFIEQANHMNRQVGKIKVPLIVLLIIFELAKVLYMLCINLGCRHAPKKYAAPIGIAAAMVISTLCCVTAANVESRRLNLIRDHGLVDKPEETVPMMSIFWLVPQFCLLAGLSSFLENSVLGFFTHHIPPSMIDYVHFFHIGIFGLGNMASVLSVYLAGKVSKMGSRETSWFQDSLNKSRLDKYYWLLAALSAANLVFYMLVASFFPFKEAAPGDRDEEQTQLGVFPIVYSY